MPPLLRWGNSGSFFLWLLEAFFVTVIILALCYVPLRGFRILSAYEQYAPEIKTRIESIAVFVKLKAGKPEDARSYLTEMDYHVDKLQNDAVRKTWQGILQNRECLYRLLTEGGSEELLSAYRQELTGCKDLHDQVVTRMNIARCLLDLGRGDEARSHLEFVAQNGGKLAIRAKAQQRLAELDGAGEEPERSAVPENPA